MLSVHVLDALLTRHAGPGPVRSKSDGASRDEQARATSHHHPTVGATPINHLERRGDGLADLGHEVVLPVQPGSPGSAPCPPVTNGRAGQVTYTCVRPDFLTLDRRSQEPQRALSQRRALPAYCSKASSRSTLSGVSPESSRRLFTARRLPVSSYRRAYSIARRSLSGALILPRENAREPHGVPEAGDRSHSGTGSNPPTAPLLGLRSLPTLRNPTDGPAYLVLESFSISSR